ncbi:MAG: O-antigen polysaccharide polymerase Wzy [Candidatus Korobacteraceae bacterium]
MSAAIEVLAFLAVMAAASLSFAAGWLGVDGAIVLTVMLLVTLIVLSWARLGQGRHPCFLFLCTLTLFQGGRLIAFCLGAEPNPLRVELMGSSAFALPREVEGLVLLCVALSAVCIYAPCRWCYRTIPPPDVAGVRRYLPYLYLVFFASLPILLWKSYTYFQYARSHGGYLFLYVNRTAMQSRFPLILRLLSQVALPAFFAIFVFEPRRSLRNIVTILYFSAASVMLLLGQRSSFFVAAAALWYVARIKTVGNSRIYVIPVLILLAVLASGLIQSIRENPDEWSISESLTTFPTDFLRFQGSSLGVTETAIQYRSQFAKYGASYLFHELQAAFLPSDAKYYVRGNVMSLDISAFLNPVTFDAGVGTGGSYIAEGYVLGWLPGVVAVSLAVSFGLILLHRLSGTAMFLVPVALTVSDVIWLPRGELLDWASALTRNLIVICFLYAIWLIYYFVASTVRHDTAAQASPKLDETQ